MTNPSFLSEAWEDYIYWQGQDKKTLNRINRLLDDISRNGCSVGIGKPEQLSGGLTGWYSRRIDDTNRLVYRIEGNFIVVAQCRSHYGK